MIAAKILVGCILAAGWIWIVGMVLMLARDAQQKTAVYKARPIEGRLAR